MRELMRLVETPEAPDQENRHSVRLSAMHMDEHATQHLIWLAEKVMRFCKSWGVPATYHRNEDGSVQIEWTCSSKVGNKMIETYISQVGLR